MTTAKIDFYSPEFLADPYVVYARLRQLSTPFRQPGESGWLFTRYDDVAAMLKDPRITKHSDRPSLAPIEMSMLFQDPPTHQRLRGLVNQAFTQSRVQALEERITQITDQLIDAVAPHRHMEFMAQFALQLPIIVISEIIGVPEADQEKFFHWSEQFAKASTGAPTPELLRETTAIIAELNAFLIDLIERRRVEPQNAILDALIRARDVNDRLSTDELLGTVTLLMAAGHETTVNLLGNGLLCLLRHPDQLSLLKRRMDLMPSAIEEMLRYEAPVQRGSFRVVVEPITIRGVTIEPGAHIWAAIGAANRDPEQFVDPDRFDITRTPNKHLAFGHGIHYCLGSGLARSEARIAFTQLFTRLPNLQEATQTPTWMPKLLLRGLDTIGLGHSLQRTPPLEWRPDLLMRGLKTLRVCW